MPHYQMLTRLIFLTVNIVLYLLAVLARQEYPNEVNELGFITGAIAIFFLLPWYLLKRNLFTTTPLWLLIGIGLSLLTIWLWLSSI